MTAGPAADILPVRGVAEPGQAELVVFVGLQASGKSSFYRERFLGSHVHVSKDLLGRSSGKERRQTVRVAEALAGARSVVVDNTNPRRADRRALIELGRRYGATVVAYCFDTPVSDAIRRNAGREGRARVPVVAILATARKFEPPTVEEGFDEVIAVRLGPAGFETRPATGRNGVSIATAPAGYTAGGRATERRERKVDRGEPWNEPDAPPEVQGASRGKGDRRDADQAGGGERAGASTEYAANTEPGRSTDEGYVEGGAEDGTAADLDPHEPPGQG